MQFLIGESNLYYGFRKGALFWCMIYFMFYSPFEVDLDWERLTQSFNWLYLDRYVSWLGFDFVQNDYLKVWRRATGVMTQEVTHSALPDSSVFAFNSWKNIWLNKPQPSSFWLSELSSPLETEQDIYRSLSNNWWEPELQYHRLSQPPWN